MTTSGAVPVSGAVPARDAVAPVSFAPDPDRFRQALGHFCTGVTVVTTMDGVRPAGFACQAFAALSLEPPLVLFCPSRTSSSWPRIERAGHFCVNVLAEEQRDVSRAFGTSGADKFSGLRWSTSPSGAPVLDGVLTWIDCAIEAVHSAGDHHVVVGRVTALGAHRLGRPLLFYRGRYAATEPAAASLAEPPEVVDTLLAWSRHMDWM
jgi:3-hydroxy-9,10-secoandrosta-1,3,5(10)-triene-9,17-dione monooxygenase reductase component